MLLGGGVGIICLVFSVVLCHCGHLPAGWVGGRDNSNVARKYRLPLLLHLLLPLHRLNICEPFVALLMLKQRCTSISPAAALAFAAARALLSHMQSPTKRPLPFQLLLFWCLPAMALALAAAMALSSHM